MLFYDRFVVNSVYTAFLFILELSATGTFHLNCWRFYFNLIYQLTALTMVFKSYFCFAFPVVQAPGHAL